MKLRHCIIAAMALTIGGTTAQAIPYAPEFMETEQTNGSVEYIKFGNFDQWLVRNIKESAIIGGNTKTLYAVAPNATWNNNNVYSGLGGSPWATSNVLAKVAGVVKTNTSVYREARAGHGYCAKLLTHVEQVKVMGLVNIKVMAAGSLFLGKMMEPITGTKNPMSKMDSGIKFGRRPTALCFDYKVQLSGQPNRVKQTGFSKVSTVQGMDMADCVLYLQKRWEDADGNILAKRVGTMVQRFNRNTGWVNNAKFTIHYGDITKQSFYKSYMGLTTGDFVKYARNSKGKLVKIQEVGWADANETPTHIVLAFNSSHGGAYIGSEGNTLWVDNVRLCY